MRAADACAAVSLTAAESDALAETILRLSPISFSPARYQQKESLKRLSFLIFDCDYIPGKNEYPIDIANLVAFTLLYSALL